MPAGEVICSRAFFTSKNNRNGVKIYEISNQQASKAVKK
jgi:hypothetical protein